MGQLLHGAIADINRIQLCRMIHICPGNNQIITGFSHNSINIKITVGYLSQFAALRTCRCGICYFKQLQRAPYC
jgi:hypothetical protein